MRSSFSEISKGVQRDELSPLDKEVAKQIKGQASSNKQIFTFIYHNIFLSIDAMAGHLDIMGEMYSEFLKYALGDGKYSLEQQASIIADYWLLLVYGINEWRYYQQPSRIGKYCGKFSLSPFSIRAIRDWLSPVRSPSARALIPSAVLIRFTHPFFGRLASRLLVILLSNLST
ncbi:hypothetical protein J2125_002787 [Erwinia toletana]|uniref:Uncharacterized protein n=1 Tax=Winslowiella toletana TaxID=92490 RepID=A0ABS4PAD0_9GAMM|nr:hypothetical protein [Winslowiella toletana]MBP2169595.1 hypothetical protein [Winslowiella toletana]